MELRDFLTLKRRDPDRARERQARTTVDYWYKRLEQEQPCLDPALASDHRAFLTAWAQRLRDLADPALQASLRAAQDQRTLDQQQRFDAAMRAELDRWRQADDPHQAARDEIAALEQRLRLLRQAAGRL